MGQFTTKKIVVYPNVRLMKDAKHLPPKGDKSGVTFLNFACDSRGDVDTVWVDANVYKGAELAGNYKKGDIVTITGEETMTLDQNGKLRFKVNVMDISSTVKLKDRAQESAGDGGAEPASDTGSAAGPGEGAPAFD